MAHEALLREWPRLHTWLEADAEGRRIHQHLINAARDWDEGGRDPGELYRGARLASALDWNASHEAELNELEREFVRESRAEAEREAEHQRRTNRRLRALLAGLAVLLGFAVLAGVVALNQRGEARDAARSADAQRLGIEAVGQERLDESLLVTKAAVELDEIPRHARQPAVGPAARSRSDRRAQPRLADVRGGLQPRRAPDSHGRRSRRGQRLRLRHPAPGRPALRDRRRSHPERALHAGRQVHRDQLHGPAGPGPQRGRARDRRTNP